MSPKQGSDEAGHGAPALGAPTRAVLARGTYAVVLVNEELAVWIVQFALVDPPREHRHDRPVDGLLVKAGQRDTAEPQDENNTRGARASKYSVATFSCAGQGHNQARNRAG